MARLVTQPRTSWVSLAVGLGISGFAHAFEPLPARELDRPLVLPDGWLTVGLEGQRDRLVGTLTLGLPQMELAVRTGGLSRDPSWEPILGLRWSVLLLRAEASPRSVAVFVDGSNQEGPGLGMAFRHALGPTRWTVEIGVVRGAPLDLSIQGEGLLQVGPLAVRVPVSGRWGEDVRRSAGLGGVVQVSRGFSLEATGGWGWSTTGRSGWIHLAVRIASPWKRLDVRASNKGITISPPFS